MTQVVSGEAFGRVENTVVHPAFWGLHARLTGADFQELRASGVPLHTLLSLYPVEMSAYLPVLAKHFSSVAAIEYFSELERPTNVLDTAVYMMLDTAVLDPLVRASFAASEVADFMLATAQRHNADRGVRPALTVRHLTSQVRELFELLMLLRYWSARGWQRLGSGDKAGFERHLAAVQAYFERTS